MLKLRPLDERVPIQQQLNDETRPAILVNIFTVAPGDVDDLLAEKRILRLDRLRLRGPNGARDEFLLAATAQNLRKLAKLIPMPSPHPA